MLRDLDSAFLSHMRDHSKIRAVYFKPVFFCGGKTRYVEHKDEGGNLLKWFH
jgi:hypothetical protein